MGKEPPWHDSIQKAWHEYLQKSHKSCPGVPASAVPDKDVASILQSAARGMAGVDRSRFIQNVGRNVSHHSGWLAFMLQRKLMRKHRGSRRSGVLTFASKHYKLSKITPSALSKIAVMGSTGKVLLNLQVPRNIEQWKSSMQQATSQVPTSVSKCGYHWPWLVRMAMISAMRVEGIKRLEFAKDLDVRYLHNLFPDQKNHLARFAKPTDSVHSLCKRLGYDGPLELLTMHLCFFCSRTMEHVCPKKVHRLRESLVKKCERYEQEHGLVPHCSIVRSWVQE